MSLNKINFNNNILKIIILGIVVRYYINSNKTFQNNVIKKFDKISLTAADRRRYFKKAKHMYKSEKEQPSETIINYKGAEMAFEDYSIVNECLKLNFYVDDSMVVESIKNDKKFKTNNKFDKDLLEKYLVETNLTEAEFKKLRLFKLYKKQWEFYIKNTASLNVSEQDVLQYLRGKNQLRSGEYCVINKKKLNPEATDEEVFEYYTKNIHKYKKDNIHKMKIAKMLKRDYAKLTQQDKNLLLDFVKENNFNWLTKEYKFSITTGDIKNIEPFEEEINLPNNYQKKFLLSIIKRYNTLALNTCIAINDKHENIFVFYCYDIVKNKHEEFAEIKEKVKKDLLKTKYIELAKQSDYTMKEVKNLSLEKQELKYISNYLFRNEVKINEIKYFEDNNSVYIIKLKEINNRETFTEEEIKNATKTLKNNIEFEAVKASKQAVLKKNNQS